MRHDEVAPALGELGLSEFELAAIALLPVLQVAWADGRIEPAELDELAAITLERGLAPGLLRRQPFAGWIQQLPAYRVFGRARELLVRLVHRDPDQGVCLPPDSIERLESDCMRMALVSGGAGGRGTVCTAERQVMKLLCDSITRDLAALQLAPSAACRRWATTLSALDGAA